MDYKKSGVDIEAGYKSVELMKEAVKSTMREEVLGGIGGFSGAFSLAKINVMEEKRQNETSENRKYYQGLPITSMSVALPLLFVFAPLCRGYFLIWLHLLVLAVGVLFITDFRFRKPTNKELAVLVAVVGVAVLRGLLIWKGGRTI